MRKTVIVFTTAAVAVAIAAVFVIRGGGRAGRQKEKVIATINGEAVYVSDFNRALALSFKRDPMFRVTPQTLEKQVNMLIDKRLLIQEAREEGLDETERFVNTIKTFWEQTLIRDLMAHKDKEISGSVTVSEKEIRDYYGLLSHQKTFQVVKSKDKSLIPELIRKDPASVEWDETIGPVSYSDISSEILMKAFKVPEGETQVFRDKDMYYLFYVKEDASVSVAPFDEIKDEIEQKVINAKKHKLFKDWLRSTREKADIRINENVLRGERYRHE